MCVPCPPLLLRALTSLRTMQRALGAHPVAQMVVTAVGILIKCPETFRPRQLPRYPLPRLNIPVDRAKLNICRLGVHLPPWSLRCLLLLRQRFTRGVEGWFELPRHGDRSHREYGGPPQELKGHVVV
jgi:hypothetical protein